MRRYLVDLIVEKGRDLDSEIGLDGHIGLTWEMLVDFICGCDSATQGQIRNMLVRIDFKNGDVFHYLAFLANGMVESLGMVAG